MKTVTFSIGPLAQLADDFSRTFDAVRPGGALRPNRADQVGFTSIEAGP